MFFSFTESNLNVDSVVEQNYRPLPQIDEVLKELLRGPAYAYANEEGYVRTSQLGLLFALRGQKLNEAIAAELGVPPSPGLATRYLRYNPLYEVTGEREFQAVRLRSQSEASTEQRTQDRAQAKDDFVRAHFRKVPELDALLCDILQTSGSSNGFVSAVDLGSIYTMRHRVRLNEAVARALGIPVMPGLASRYLRLNDTFESRAEGANIAFRMKGAVTEPEPVPTAVPAHMLDKEDAVRRHFRICRAIDARVVGCLRTSYDQDADGYVLLVTLAGDYRRCYGVSLNETIAQALKLPSFPGLAARYLRLNPTFEIKPETSGSELAIRAAGAAVAKPKRFLVRLCSAFLRLFRPVRAPAAKATKRPAADPPHAELPRGRQQESSSVPLPPRRAAPQGGALTIVEPPRPRLTVPDVSEWLEAFAFLIWDSLLTRLAQVAQPENWGPRHEVLRSKLKYTFLWEAKRFMEASPKDRARFLHLDPQGGCAIMHTGLQSVTGDEIYIVFQRNLHANRQPWFANVHSVVTQRELVRTFEGPLPQWPAFLSAAASPRFITDIDITMSPESILSHLRNLPERVLRIFCRNNSEALTLLPGFLENQNTDRFMAVFRNDSDCMNTFNVTLHRALTNTLSAIRRDYRILVPCYYPPADSISLMAPITFFTSDSPVADAALVLTYDATENVYVVRTLLSQRMAYGNARLIAKPTVDWLAPPEL